MTDDLRHRMYAQQSLSWLRRIDAKLASLDVRLQILAEICDRMTRWEPLTPASKKEGFQSVEEVLTLDRCSKD